MGTPQQLRYREALNQALREELARDERVMLMGEDIGVFGGAFKVTDGLLEEFGEKRIRDTPISENTIVGLGVGAAMTGLRPVVELMTINFALLALDQIVNHAAHIHYMFGGQARVPLVVRMPQGAGHQLGPTHSHCFEAMFLQVPGLLVAVPATAADAKGLLKSAIRDENPVVFIEHESLYGVRGEVPEGEQLVPFGVARTAREGSDVTIVGISRMALTAERAAGTLSRGARRRGGSDRSTDPAPARPRHDPGLGPADEPLRHSRGGLASRWRRREPGGPDRRTGLRPPRRARREGHGRGRPDALLQAARGHRLSARAADRGSGTCHAQQDGPRLMSEIIVMPRLSDTMEEGIILRWLRAEGEEIARGEELVEIETDKATMTYESDLSGVLHLIAAEGDSLPVGQPIASVGDGPAGGDAPAEAGAAEAPLGATEAPGGEPVTAAARALQTRAPAPAGPPPAAATPASHPDAPVERVKASPLARRMAREGGVELAGLSGSGPGGRIVKADVLGAGREPAGTAPRAPDEIARAKGETREVELTRLQQTVARRMAESKATIPDFTLQIEIDMEECVSLRTELKAIAASSEAGEHAEPAEQAVPTYNDMVVKAVALALREHPLANGSYRDGKVQLHSRINIGVAVAAEGALVVPTVFDAEEKSLGEIARETRALAGRVRDGSITPPELGGGTFTVSNLGMFGISSFSAIINPPQAAILSVGALAPRAVVHDGEILARDMMSLTLVSDHRILYGAEAARFLARVRELLQAPSALTL